MKTRFLICLLLLVLPAPVLALTPSSPVPRAAFGAAVALTGDLLFVGEPQSFKDPGTVHVYRRNGDAWTLVTRLTASDAEVGDGFGQALATDGERLAVAGGAAVYVFERSGDTWTEAARLAAPGEGDAFGQALALGGDHLLVAAPGHDARRGTVYVFARGTEGAWTAADTLHVDDLRPGDALGSALALGGDRLLVAAPGRNEGAGAAFAFRREGDRWVREAVLVPAGAGPGSRAGSALALDGDYAFLGAPRHNGFTGAVFTFHRHADGTWTEWASLAPEKPGERDFFGAALAAGGGLLWVGAPGTGGFAGQLTAFLPTGEGWTPDRTVQAGTVRPGDAFGSTFAVSTDLLAVAAPRDDYGEGSVHLFARIGRTWHPQAFLIHEAEPFPALTGEREPCAGGSAAGFDCRDVDLLAFIPNRDMDIGRGVRLNDVWGWTDPETGREYALVGHMEGTVFLDVSDPTRPVYLGTLPMHEGATGNTWRDMKVYRNHAFIVADGAGPHGMQVFDLTRLRRVENPPVTFTEDAHYDRIASAHNIVINEETGFAYAVGAGMGGETCGGGLHMIDLREPKKPRFAGCFGHEGTGRQGTGYIHDAQCVVYRGPDADYRGKELCFSANETAISIVDVTDKANPKAIASGTYPNFGYVHQGWLSEDHRFFFQNDETDELNGNVDRTRTLVWDLADLDDPVLVKEYFGPTSATDHNLYVRGHLMYQTNNASGLRILDVSDPLNPVEVAHFDTTPYGKDVAGFNGTWSSYPYFESGTIVVTSRREGVFLLKKKDIDL
ncbi:MAG: hypothetical protein KatS3mg043_0445 [Rhodothermaceae bacterium]|nr:MAG: hypothetical protein KatS3mg043_0445 [Rhodothermaceae bacterium]